MTKIFKNQKYFRFAIIATVVYVILILLSFSSIIKTPNTSSKTSNTSLDESLEAKRKNPKNGLLEDYATFKEDMKSGAITKVYIENGSRITGIQEKNGLKNLVQVKNIDKTTAKQELSKIGEIIDNTKSEPLNRLAALASSLLPIIAILGPFVIVYFLFKAIRD